MPFLPFATDRQEDLDRLDFGGLAARSTLRERILGLSPAPSTTQTRAFGTADDARAAPALGSKQNGLAPAPAVGRPRNLAPKCRTAMRRGRSRSTA